MRKKALDPSYREKLSRNAKIQFSTPEGKRRCSDGQKRRFSRPEERKKISIKSRAAYANNPQLAANMSLIKKKLYNEKPGLSEAHSIKMKERHKNNPELGKKQAEMQVQRASKTNLLWNELMSLTHHYNTMTKISIPNPTRKRGAIKNNDLIKLIEDLKQKIKEL